MWIPGYEQSFNQTLSPKVTFALASEYLSFSVPSSARYGDYPRDATYRDVISDSLLVIPRLQNYADKITSFYDTVVPAEEPKKP